MSALTHSISGDTVVSDTGSPTDDAQSKAARIDGYADDEDDVVPAMHAARTLILCFDGTGDQFDDDNSNVVQLVSMLKKHDPDEQMVYYQTGIGTYTGPGATVNSFTRTFWKLADQAVAWSLSYHVQGGYEFLMSHYRAGDKICIFGFSRGAYTARALAGMLHKVGLLPPGNRQTVPFAYKMFRREDDRGWAQSTAFKKAFCIDVDIEFLGVWDTVASVGLIPRHLPFTTNNTSIKTFRQAVSLDEHRAKFKVNHWHRHSPEQEKLGTQPGDMPRSSRRAAHPDQHDNGDGKHTDKGKHTQKKTKGRGWTKTDVLEVWFAGCHADVGGGSVRNDTPHSLSRIPLRWMVRQCFLARTGILFHGRALRAFGVDPAALYPTVQPRPPALGLRDNTVLCEHLSKVAAEGKCADSIPGSKDIEFGKVGKMASEEEEDLADALCPLYDELTIAKWWWILEILPLRVRQQAENASWFSCWTIHLGRPRELPKHHLRAGVKVHRTVKTRMEAAKMLKGAHYNPRVVFDGDPTWVD